MTLGARLGVRLPPIQIAVEAPADMSAVHAFVLKRLSKRIRADCAVRRVSRLIRVECDRSNARDFIDYVCDWNETGAELTPLYGMTDSNETKWLSMPDWVAEKTHARISNALMS